MFRCGETGDYGTHSIARRAAGHYGWLCVPAETAKPMRALAEVLLRGPSSLTSGEREMIAAFVSTRNDCYFCQTSHRAAAAHHLGRDYELVDAVRFDYENAPVSSKLKALLGHRSEGAAGRQAGDGPGHSESPDGRRDGSSKFTIRF